MLGAVSAKGREKLQVLEERYQAAGGRMRPATASLITYLIVHERERGMISS